MKKLYLLGIIIAIALIIFGAVYPTPAKHLRTSSYGYDLAWTNRSGEEYVGGDAYNYQMEASLKAGYMGGVLAMKSITFVGGILLFFLTVYAKHRDQYMEEQIKYLKEIPAGVSAVSAKLDGFKKEEPEAKETEA